MDINRFFSIIGTGFLLGLSLLFGTSFVVKMVHGSITFGEAIFFVILAGFLFAAGVFNLVKDIILYEKTTRETKSKEEEKSGIVSVG